MLLPKFPYRDCGLRVIAAFLALSFTLSSPALALRTEQKENQSGLEEIRLALEGGRPDRLLELANTALGLHSSSAAPTTAPPPAISPRPAAGAEERKRVRWLTQEGNKLRKQGRPYFSEAERELLGALHLGAEDVGTLFTRNSLAQLYLKWGKYAEGVGLLRETQGLIVRLRAHSKGADFLNEINRQEPFTLNTLANLLDHQGETGIAVAVLSSDGGKSLKPLLQRDPVAHLVLSKMLQVLKRYGDAEALLQTALSVYPEVGFLHFGLGQLYLAMGETVKAQEAFGEAFRLMPNDPLAEEYALRDWVAVARFELEQAARRPDSGFLKKEVPSLTRFIGKVLPLQGAGKFPEILEGEALYLGASGVAELRSGRSRKEIALLIDFSDYRKPDGKLRKLFQKFSPHNVPGLKALVFYNAPGDLQTAIDTLAPQVASFKQLPVAIIPFALQLADETAIKIHLEATNSGVVLTLPPAAGAEEMEILRDGTSVPKASILAVMSALGWLSKKKPLLFAVYSSWMLGEGPPAFSEAQQKTLEDWALIKKVGTVDETIGRIVRLAFTREDEDSPWQLGSPLKEPNPPAAGAEEEWPVTLKNARLAAIFLANVIERTRGKPITLRIFLELGRRARAISKKELNQLRDIEPQTSQSFLADFFDQLPAILGVTEKKKAANFFMQTIFVSMLIQSIYDRWLKKPPPGTRDEQVNVLLADLSLDTGPEASVVVPILNKEISEEDQRGIATRLLDVLDLPLSAAGAEEVADYFEIVDGKKPDGPKVLFLFPPGPKVIEEYGRLSGQLFVLKDAREPSSSLDSNLLRRLVRQIDPKYLAAFVNDRVDAQLLSADVTPSLKGITHMGLGTDNIDLEAARRRGLKVSSVGGGDNPLRKATAEMAAALALTGWFDLVKRLEPLTQRSLPDHRLGPFLRLRLTLNPGDRRQAADLIWAALLRQARKVDAGVRLALEDKFRGAGNGTLTTVRGHQLSGDPEGIGIKTRLGLIGSAPFIERWTELAKAYEIFQVVTLAEAGTYDQLAKSSDYVLRAPEADGTVSEAMRQDLDGKRGYSWLIDADGLQLKRDFPPAEMGELFSQPLEKRTIGFIGLGTVGATALQFLQPFAGRLLGVQHNPQKAANYEKLQKQFGIQYTDLDNLLKQSNIVVLSLPGSGDAMGLVNAARLERLGIDNLLIVNIGRGKTLARSLEDETRLANYIRDHPGVRLATDVLFDETLPLDQQPLLAPDLRDRILVTAHIASNAEQPSGPSVREDGMGMVMVRNFKAMLTGESLPNPVLSAAGAEESHADRVRLKVAAQLSNPRLPEHARLSFDTPKPTLLLVQGTGSEIYLHLHLELTDDLGERVLNNGLLFPVHLEKDQLIFGHPFAEIWSFSAVDLARQFVPLEGLISPSAMDRLMGQVVHPELWIDRISNGYQLSEQALKEAVEGRKRHSFILGISVTPRESGLFIVEPRKFWDKNPVYTNDAGVTFARADHVTPKEDTPAAGAEETAQIAGFGPPEKLYRVLEKWLKSLPWEEGFPADTAAVQSKKPLRWHPTPTHYAARAASLNLVFGKAVLTLFVSQMNKREDLVSGVVYAVANSRFLQPDSFDGGDWKDKQLGLRLSLSDALNQVFQNDGAPPQKSGAEEVSAALLMGRFLMDWVRQPDSKEAAQAFMQRFDRDAFYLLTGEKIQEGLEQQKDLAQFLPRYRESEDARKNLQRTMDVLKVISIDPATTLQVLREDAKKEPLLRDLLERFDALRREPNQKFASSPAARAEEARVPITDPASLRFPDVLREKRTGDRYEVVAVGTKDVQLQRTTEPPGPRYVEGLVAKSFDNLKKGFEKVLAAGAEEKAGVQRLLVVGMVQENVDRIRKIAEAWRPGIRLTSMSGVMSPDPNFFKEAKGKFDVVLLVDTSTAVGTLFSIMGTGIGEFRSNPSWTQEVGRIFQEEGVLPAAIRDVGKVTDDDVRAMLTKLDEKFRSRTAGAEEDFDIDSVAFKVLLVAGLIQDRNKPLAKQVVDISGAVKWLFVRARFSEVARSLLNWTGAVDSKEFVSSVNQKLLIIQKENLDAAVHLAVEFSRQGDRERRMTEWREAKAKILDKKAKWLTASAEEKGTPEAGRAALRTFLATVGDATMEGLSPFDSAKPVTNLIVSFPQLHQMAQDAGYAQGVAELIWFSKLPSAPLTSTRNVFVQKGVSWNKDGQVEKGLEGYVNFVATPEMADLIIAEDRAEIRVSPHQVFLQVNADTARAVTPGLLRHLEDRHLLNPGSVVVLDILLKRVGDDGEDVRLFA